MKAAVFFDAFAECLVNVAMVRQYPRLHEAMRSVSIAQIAARHGPAHAENTGRMFDKLLSDMQSPGARR
jgi:hypothetical protein